MLMVVFVVMLMLLMPVVMAAAGAALVMLMVMFVMMLMGKAFHLRFQAVFIHGLAYLAAGELSPGCAYKPCMAVQALQELRCRKHFFRACSVGTAHDDKVCVLHLVIEKLAKVSHVHAAFPRVDHGDLCPDCGPLNAGYGLCHIAQLANAGGLYNNTVRSVVGHHLFQRLGEVANKGAADTA